MLFVEFQFTHTTVFDFFLNVIMCTLCWKKYQIKEVKEIVLLVGILGLSRVIYDN